jgi:hypothetical protein
MALNHSMKNALLIIIISLFSFHALAQINVSEGLDKKISFGLKIGIGSSIVAFNDTRYSNMGSNAGGHASLFLNKPIAEKFALQGGLSYTDRGFATTYQSYNPNLNTISVISEAYQLFYIEVPLNGVLKLPLGKGKVLLGGGPYIGYALGGKEQKFTTEFSSTGTPFDEKEEELKLSYGNKTTDDFKKTDLGFNFLTGYQFKKGWLLNINYAQGIQNILPKEQTGYGEKAINAAFHFCIGYEF